MLRIFVVISALFAGCAASADQAREDAYARAFLDILQQRTLTSGREYCGYFGYDTSGRIVATPARRGRLASCRPRWPEADVDVFASYHTHGAFDPRYFNELPSSDDVLTDRSDGIMGYIGTPGGRVWRVNGPDGTAEIVCGIACIHSDPEFIPGSDGEIPNRLTLDQILTRERR
ncbi:MAG: DUF4329 domain-containing protein [Pseudomonadota bacterium]